MKRFHLIFLMMICVVCIVPHLFDALRTVFPPAHAQVPCCAEGLHYPYWGCVNGQCQQVYDCGVDNCASCPPDCDPFGQLEANCYATYGSCAFWNDETCTCSPHPAMNSCAPPEVWDHNLCACDCDNMARIECYQLMHSNPGYSWDESTCTCGYVAIPSICYRDWYPSFYDYYSNCFCADCALGMCCPELYIYYAYRDSQGNLCYYGVEWWSYGCQLYPGEWGCVYLCW